MTTLIEPPGVKRKIRQPKSPELSTAPSTPQWAAVNNLPASGLLPDKVIPRSVTPKKRAEKVPSSKAKGSTKDNDESTQQGAGLNARVTKRLPVREKKVMPSIEVHGTLLSSDAASSSGSEYDDEEGRNTTTPHVDHEPPTKKQRVIGRGPLLKNDLAGWFEHRKHKGRYTKRDMKEMQDAIRRARYGTANPCKPTQEEAQAQFEAVTARMEAENSQHRQKTILRKRVSKSTHLAKAGKKSSENAARQCPSPPESSPAHTGPAPNLGGAAESFEDVAARMSPEADQVSTPAIPSSNAEPGSRWHPHPIPEQSTNLKHEESNGGGPVTLSSDRQIPPEGYVWDRAGADWITEVQSQLETAKGKIAAFEKRLEVDGIELQHQLTHEAEIKKKSLSTKAEEQHKDSGKSSQAVASDQQPRKEGEQSGKERRQRSLHRRQRQKERKKAKRMLKHAQLANAQVLTANAVSPDTELQSPKRLRRGSASSMANDVSSRSLSANNDLGGRLQRAMRDGLQQSATAQEAPSSTATKPSNSHPRWKGAALAQGTPRDAQNPITSSPALCTKQTVTNMSSETKQAIPKHLPPNQRGREMQRRGNLDPSRQWQRPFARREVIIPEVLPRCVCQLLHFYFETGLNKKPSLEAFPGTREEFFANVEQIVQCRGHDKEMILFCEGLWEIEKVNRKYSHNESTLFLEATAQGPATFANADVLFRPDVSSSSRQATLPPDYSTHFGDQILARGRRLPEQRTETIPPYLFYGTVAERNRPRSRTQPPK
ncbi:MAG: hypothetical protein M1830_003017 [Pleopsidium flavum]|nr:MAG: hypothetical protein M1830_003017 [Pleopsidium flavum]